jgi:hypothetical protein
VTDLIEKLDMTTILDEVARSMYDAQASIQPELDRYDDLEPFAKFSVKKNIIECVTTAAKVAVPHLAAVLEAERLDMNDRFLDAVTGVEIEMPGEGSE